MSSTKRPPAILGANTGPAVEITRQYPSIAATWYGRALGQLLDCIPAKVGGIKLSHLLFGLPVGLLALPMYFLLKGVGEVYFLTAHAVQRRKSLTYWPIQEVKLMDVDKVVVRQLAGQHFYPAGEIELVNAAGDVMMTLSGVLRPEVFRQTILEARDARRQVESSLATIRARHA